MATKTIVFIHGAFVTKHSWTPWVERYQAQGYNAIALPWPGRDEPVKALKQAHPDSQLGQLSLKQIMDHYINTLQALDEKPVLIGHSLGGLLAQLLLQWHLGVAGIAIDSVPPLGVIPTQWSFYRAGWPLINPFIPASRPYYMTFKEFQYAFVNGLPLAEQQAAYETQLVPESRRVVRGGLTFLAKIDFMKPRPPLLLIAGAKDQFIPAALNKANYERYQGSPSVTDFKEFSGRTHYIIGQKGWEVVANYALGWLHQHKLLADRVKVPVAA